MTQTLCDKLKMARERIAAPTNWRRGGHPDVNAACDTPPFCAGSALWDKGNGTTGRAIEVEATRAVLATAGLKLPDPPDEGEEINALVDWNDTSNHATVLAAFDRAIEECCR